MSSGQNGNNVKTVFLLLQFARKVASSVIKVRLWGWKCVYLDLITLGGVIKTRSDYDPDHLYSGQPQTSDSNTKT